MRILILVFLLAPLAIVRRADVSDSQYLQLGQRFPQVVAIGRAGDATLIAEQWLITAAHVARTIDHPGAMITVGSRSYLVDKVAIHPSWRDLGPHDVALLHVSDPVTNLEPIGLYRGWSESSVIATIVGHGANGSGDSHERVDDGLRRAATSRIDSADASWIYFSFDAPPNGTLLEGAPGAGDSGGPAVLVVKGEFKVAGISSAGYDGRNGPGSYGAVDVFTRVSTHLAWIDSVMTAPVLPEKS
jgi:hypothetical protein